MSSEFIGFRANYKKDADIVRALDNAKNRSNEIRRLIRLGIQVSQGRMLTIEPVKPKRFPPIVKQQSPAMDEEDDIIRNMMGGFN